MPFFIVLASDRADALPDRLARRQEHLNYWAARSENVKVAGAMLDNGQPGGSAFLIEATSHDEVNELLAGDPFMQAGVFTGDVTIVSVRPAIGEWLP